MADISIYDLDSLLETPADGDMFLIVDVSESTSDKTKKVTYSYIRAGLQAYSAVLDNLTDDLPSITGLVYWTGATNTPSQITVDDTLELTGTTLGLNHLGLEDLVLPPSDRLLAVGTGGAKYFTAGTGISFGASSIGISLSAGAGIAVDGNAISLNYLGLQNLSSLPGADRILFWDDSAGAMKWLSLGATSGLVISSTTLERAVEPVSMTVRAVSSGVVVEAGETYWTVPTELDGATLKSLNMAFLSASGSATVTVTRALKASPTVFGAIGSVSVSSNYSSYHTSGSSVSATVNAGDRIKMAYGTISGDPEGLDVYLGFEV